LANVLILFFKFQITKVACDRKNLNDKIWLSLLIGFYVNMIPLINKIFYRLNQCKIIVCYSATGMLFSF